MSKHIPWIIAIVALVAILFLLGISNRNCRTHYDAIVKAKDAEISQMKQISAEKEAAASEKKAEAEEIRKKIGQSAQRTEALKKKIDAEKARKRTHTGDTLERLRAAGLRPEATCE